MDPFQQGKSAVTSKKSSHLKLHIEGLPKQENPDLASFPGLADLCQAFADATGWQLQYRRGVETGDSAAPWSAVVESGFGGPLGRLSIRSLPESNRDENQQRLPLGAVQSMGEAVCQILSELEQTRYALWQREAELAAGVPVVTHSDEQAHLAERLESVLQSGAHAVGCQAAALYLLDDATSQLKLRACWGLPKSRLLEPARPLRGSVADLEALVGHAVVLEDTSILPHWKTPEDYPAAVCIPVSSPTTPLGTLWIFSDRVRDFSAEETNLLEIIAGRLASDLEREMLMQQGIQSKQLDRSLSRASAWQHDRLPLIEPMLDDWQVSGWTGQADMLGGDFYDWSVLPDGNLALAVAGAQGMMIEAGLSAASLHAAMKSHAAYPHDARQMLARLNETLWTASPGDQFASLAYGLIEPENGKLQLAAAGHPLALLVRGSTCRNVGQDSLPLGAEADCHVKPHEMTLKRGDMLLLASPGVRETLEHDGRAFQADEAASALRGARSAADLVKQMRVFLESRASTATPHDHTILVLRRR